MFVNERSQVCSVIFGHWNHKHYTVHVSYVGKSTSDMPCLFMYDVRMYNIHSIPALLCAIIVFYLKIVKIPGREAILDILNAHNAWASVSLPY